MELTIATLNIWNEPHGRWDERAPLVTARIGEIAPDLVTLQEVDQDGDRARLIADAAGYHVQHLRHRGIKSLAVLTRRQVREVEDFELGDDIALRVRIQGVDVITTHLHYGPGREGGEVRREQARRLLDWIGDRPRCVLTGDFNATPAGATIGLLKERFASAYEAVHGTEPERTWPTAMAAGRVPEELWGTLDYVFVSRDLEVLSARVDFDSDDGRGVYPSDHMGLVVHVRIPVRATLPA